MRKHLLGVLLISCLILAALPACAEDRFATRGDVLTTASFYVEAYGDTSVTFQFVQGYCKTLGNAASGPPTFTDKKTYGKYWLVSSRPDGTTTRLNLDDFTGGKDHFSLALDLKGVYKITIIPYNNKEMEKAWKNGQFVGWGSNVPTWQVSGYRGCDVMLKNPQHNHGYGTVTVATYQDGLLTGTTDVQITKDQYVLPQVIDDYTCDSEAAYVTFDRTTGGCTPSLVNYYYTISQFLPKVPRRPDDLEEAQDMGVPEIGSRLYIMNQMNLTIYWVQTQLKATGEWYHDDCTGELDNNTISAVRAFMMSRGYRYPTGNIDQNVINELADALGENLQPVYIGGIYTHMNSLLRDVGTGDMLAIVSSTRDNVVRTTDGTRWVQTCLQFLGYYEGELNGTYDEVTDRAIRTFQNDYDWVKSDHVTLGLARLLLETYYWGGGDLKVLR